MESTKEETFSRAVDASIEKEIRQGPLIYTSNQHNVCFINAILFGKEDVPVQFEFNALINVR